MRSNWGEWVECVRYCIVKALPVFKWVLLLVNLPGTNSAFWLYFCALLIAKERVNYTQYKIILAKHVAN